MPLITPDTARQMADRSKSIRRKMKLSPDDVEAALPRLVSLEDAKYRLDRLGRWIAAGLLAGSAGQAAVRSVEAWCRAFDSDLDHGSLKEAERRITELEAELKQARGGLRAVK